MSHTEEHRAEASQRLSTVGKRYFNLIEFDEGEELVTEIRKHPVGLIIIEVTGTFISFVITGAFFAVAAAMDSVSVEEIGSPSSIKTVLILFGLFSGILGIALTAISAILYRSNVIFITTEKIGQVVYKNIISRKISQLGIGDVQDVTVHQNTILSRIFHYGTLVIETAGEQQNYTFTYVPDPYENAKRIIGAHETNLRHYGN